MHQPFYDRHGKEFLLPEGETVHWRPSVYGYLNVDGKTLMIKDGRDAKVWEFPGGGINEDETIVEALKREYQEETGYKVRPVGDAPIWVICRNFYSKGYGKYFRSLLMLYRVELVDDARSLLPTNEVDSEEEISAMEWVPDAELSVANCHLMWKEFLESR